MCFLFLYLFFIFFVFIYDVFCVLERRKKKGSEQTHTHTHTFKKDLLSPDFEEHKWNIFLNDYENMRIFPYFHSHFRWILW